MIDPKKNKRSGYLAHKLYGQSIWETDGMDSVCELSSFCWLIIQWNAYVCYPLSGSTSIVSLYLFSLFSHFWSWLRGSLHLPTQTPYIWNFNSLPCWHRLTQPASMPLPSSPTQTENHLMVSVQSNYSKCKREPDIINYIILSFGESFATMIKGLSVYVCECLRVQRYLYFRCFFRGKLYHAFRRRVRYLITMEMIEFHQKFQWREKIKLPLK